MKKPNQLQIEQIYKIRVKRNRDTLKRRRSFPTKNKTRKRVSNRSAEIDLICPENFSLVNNTVETISFFDQLNLLAKNGAKIFINMQSIMSISADAILYLVHVMDTYKAKKYTYSLRGNIPSDKFARDIIEQSGFLKFVRVERGNGHCDSSEILSIEKGQIVKSQIAGKCVRFARTFMKTERELSRSGDYQVIIECMANTHNHAYRGQTKNPYWYLIAIYNKSEEVVDFAFLDGGEGIPATLNKKHFEKVQQLAARMLSMVSPMVGNAFKVDDSKLLISALDGEFRTETKLEHRGKGLPMIKKLQLNRSIQKLKIMSGKAFVDVENNINYELNGKFLGTLFSWRYAHGN